MRSKAFNYNQLTLALNQYAKALIINNEMNEAILILGKLVSDYSSNHDFKINLASAYKEVGEFQNQKKLLIRDLGITLRSFLISYLM